MVDSPTRRTTTEISADPAELRRVLEQQSSEGSTADQVHVAMITLIENGTLSPGSRLGEESLATTFQVSRTPIREALVRLETEQFVGRDRHGRLSVSRISVDRIIELYVVREALDGAAARLAATHANVLDLSKLRRINGEMEAAAVEERYDDMARINIEFHKVLAQASRNLMLESFIDQVHRFVRRFVSTTFSYPERAMTAVTEHEAILTALENQDGGAAESLARDHMRRALDVRILMEATPDEPETSHR